MDSVQGLLARPPKLSDLPPQSPAQRMRAHGRKEDFLAQQAEADEDAEERPWRPTADDPIGAMMLAVARAIDRPAQDDQAKQKKQIFGLSDRHQSGSDSSEDGTTRRGVSGTALATRLVRNMDAHPKAFNDDMRDRMVEAMGEAVDHDKRAVLYVQSLPLEKQKVLGYFAWAVAQLNVDLRAGRVARAELRTMQLIAAIQQNRSMATGGARGR